MRSTIRNRIPFAAAVATVALLTGAGSASALPSVSVGVQTGQVATEVSSDDLTNTISTGVSSQLASTQRKLRSAESRLKATRRRIQRLQRRLQSRADAEVRGTSARARSQLRALRRKARTLRRQVLSLRRKAVKQALRLQEEAIGQAKASTGGAWLVVSRSGRIVDQSGGIRVDHSDTGTYVVAYDVRRNSCLGLAAAGPAPTSIFGTVRFSRSGPGSFTVNVSGPSGLRNGGFYLAAAC